MNVPSILGFLLRSHGDSNLGRELNRSGCFRCCLRYRTEHISSRDLQVVGNYGASAISSAVRTSSATCSYSGGGARLFLRNQFRLDACISSVTCAAGFGRCVKGSCRGDVSLLYFIGDEPCGNPHFDITGDVSRLCRTVWDLSCVWCRR